MICWNKSIAGFITDRGNGRYQNNSLWFGFVKRQIHYHWGKMDDSTSSGNVIVLRQSQTGGYYKQTDRFHGRVEIGINILFPPVM